MTPLPCPSVLARRENVGRARWQLRRQRARPRLRLTLQRGKPRHMILVHFTQTPPGGGFGRRLCRRWCMGKGAALQDGFDHSPLTSLRSMGAVPLAVCKPVAQGGPRVDKSNLVRQAMPEKRQKLLKKPLGWLYSDAPQDTGKGVPVFT